MNLFRYSLEYRGFIGDATCVHRVNTALRSLLREVVIESIQTFPPPLDLGGGTPRHGAGNQPGNVPVDYPPILSSFTISLELVLDPVIGPYGADDRVLKQRRTLLA